MINDVLVAVPLFLFMGYIVERANIMERLFYSLNIAARVVPGAMAVAALMTCAVFATAVGIVGAVVTLMGLLAFPALLKAGYDEKLASGVICAGGCLGILIPPSIMLILYGAVSGVSVVRLYAGALIPGFVLAGLYIIYVIGRSWLNPKLAPKPPKEQWDIPLKELLLMILTSFVPLCVLIMAVLGAILFGLATPSEAASVGAFGSGGHFVIEEFVMGLNLSPIVFLILAQAIIFLLGWPLEWSEIIIIFVPIFLPLLDIFKIDPLFFGIIVALNLQTSFLTPPMAMSCYYLKGIAPPHIQLTTIFKGSLPFLAMVLISMVILYTFPVITTWLPSLVYGIH
jgi:TRAP-type mannitol/chloroaromatic compound transport system permease large subunit